MGWWNRLTGRGGRDTGVGTSKRVTPSVVAQLQRDGAMLLDVREPGEWAAGRAPKARHIPLAQLESRAAREVSTSSTILTICRSGSRSARAAGHLRRTGYTVADVKGGMRAWPAAGLPWSPPVDGQDRWSEQGRGAGQGDQGDRCDGFC